MLKLLTTCFFLITTAYSFAQNPLSTTVVDISLIKDSMLFAKHFLYYTDTLGLEDPEAIPANAWRNGSNIKLNKFIPNKWISRRIFLKFTLANSGANPVKVFFLPGMYVRSLDMYKLTAIKAFELVENKSKADGFQPIKLEAGEKTTFIASFKFTKKLYNYLKPQLIKDDYLARYQKFQFFRHDTQIPVGFILSGVLLMMIFFTAANYLLGRKKEFLYNCCYSICLFLLIFFTTFLEKKSGAFSSLFREFLDFMLLAVGTVFYIAFTRKFLDTKTNHPVLHKLFVYEERFVLLLLAAFTYIVFATDNFMLFDLLENSMKIIVLAFGIVYIVIALSKKNKLMNYLAIGNAILIFFSIISLLLILFPSVNTSILTSSMIYYEFGIISELICFLLGLTYKNRIELIQKTKEQESLKLEAEKQYFENKLAVINAQQEGRNRISADMHDDLGAGVTAIRLYSELAKKRVEKGAIPEIDKISASANELLNNMNAIIWTMSSSNDTLDNMAAYIRSYALEYFENTGIDCYTYVDDNLPDIAVTGEIRRNIYLVVKEALNNILKHANATKVTLSLKKEPHGLSLYIQDNGIGIDLNNLRRFGNGLINMKKRMEARRILFNIENSNGTLITLHYKIDFSTLA